MAALEACRDEANCPPADDEDLVAALLAPVPVFLRGDANRDALVNVADPVSVLGLLFAGTPAAGCMDAADANDDGAIDVSDAVVILRVLFQGGLALPPPTIEAGEDPTPDQIVCEEG